MYIPPKYEQTNLDEIEAFLQEFSFATLVSNDAAGIPMATHIPLELETKADGQKVLQGHLSKANPQWKTIAENPKILAIFLAAHSYISPSWYSQPNVPTWNYMSVHVYGKASILEGEQLREALSKMTAKYEQHQENPLYMEQLTPEYIESHLRGIVGIEIEIEHIQAAYKLSQNRDEKDYQTIIEELQKQERTDAQLIAKAMEELKSE